MSPNYRNELVSLCPSTSPSCVHVSDFTSDPKSLGRSIEHAHSSCICSNKNEVFFKKWFNDTWNSGRREILFSHLLNCYIVRIPVWEWIWKGWLGLAWLAKSLPDQEESHKQLNHLHFKWQLAPFSLLQVAAERSVAQTRLLSFLYSADVGTSSTPSLPQRRTCCTRCTNSPVVSIYQITLFK